MRKIQGIIAVLIIMMCVNVEAATYTTVKLNPAASYTAAGTKYLPAVVKGQAGAVAALETLVLALPQTKAGQIGAALAFAGITYGASKLFDYLESEGFPTNPTTGIPEKSLPAYPAPEGFESPFGSNTLWVRGWYPNSSAAINACLALSNTTGCTTGAQGAYAYAWTRDAENHGADYYTYVFFYSGTPTEAGTKNVPVTESEVAGAISTGIANQEKAADDAVNDTLNRVNESLQNLNDTLRNSPKWSDIQSYLDSSIDQSTKTSLDTKLADPNASSTYASQTTTTNTTSTTNNTTYNTTTNNYYENQGTFAPLSQYNQGTQTTKSAFEQPEVGDFSKLMSDFIDTMQNTDLFSLPGLMTSSIPSGGDCQLTINLGQHFGGTKTISFCEWATALSYIKAVLLCLASVVAVGIVCKGGAA